MNKIISISVWGNNPRYCVGAIKNAKLAKKLLPDWKCRIFLDDSVPLEYQRELFDMDNVEIAQVEDERVFGAFWRFYSMFESENNITISRDSDSRISEREVHVLNEWLKSDKKFSIIRDHERHYDWPILAGMWGMKGKLSSELLDVMIEYSKKHFYTSDQIFLAEKIWPISENDCLIHSYKEVKWMKENKDQIKYDFIGQGYDENDVPIYDYKETGVIINNGQK